MPRRGRRRDLRRGRGRLSRFDDAVTYGGDARSYNDERGEREGPTPVHLREPWVAFAVATVRTACAKRRARCGESAPARSSTTNAVAAGSRWFSQPTTLPGSRGRRASRRPVSLAKRRSIAGCPPRSEERRVGKAGTSRGGE